MHSDSRQWIESTGGRVHSHPFKEEVHMGDILDKGTYTGHLTWNFVGEIRFSSLTEKVGQVVCLRQAYNQCGLVGSTGSAQWSQVIFLPLCSLARESLVGSGEVPPLWVPLCLCLSWGHSLWWCPACNVCVEFSYRYFVRDRGHQYLGHLLVLVLTLFFFYLFPSSYLMSL